MFTNEFDGISNSMDLLGDVISNLESKFIFHGHNQLYNVQRIQLQIVLEMSRGSHLNG